VAYIATQHPQHKPAVLLCLAAGKAVLCEKPMGVNAAEVREMVAKARSQGVFLMEVSLERPLSHPYGAKHGCPGLPTVNPPHHTHTQKDQNLCWPG